MLMILSGAIVAFAPNFPVMLVGRVLVGVALGGFWSLSAATAMRLVPPGPCQRRSPWSILVPRWPRRSQPLLAALSAAFWAGAGLSSPSSAGRCSTGMDGNLASLASGPATQDAGSMIDLLRKPGVAHGYLGGLLFFAGTFWLFTYLRPFL
jgi:predicted MFS family arabinose efflux permease